MGLTIATKDIRLTLKIDDQQADALFREIASDLLRRSLSLPEEETPEESQKELEEVELEGPEEQKGYGGFLYLECSSCGRRKAFCSRHKLNYYSCECGERTSLHDLAKVYVNCECGKRSDYWTNVTDDVFDVDCVNCGAPVAVQYNSKKKIYETI